ASDTLFTYFSDTDQLLLDTVSAKDFEFRGVFSCFDQLYFKGSFSVSTFKGEGQRERLLTVDHSIANPICSEDYLYFTSENGLIKIHLNHALQVYGANSQMPKTVWSFAEDLLGRIWFSSFSESSINLIENDIILTFEPSKNNVDIHYYYPGGLRVHSGDIWFPTGRNIVITDPIKKTSKLLSDSLIRGVNYVYQVDSLIYAASNYLRVYNENHELVNLFSDEDGLAMKQHSFLEVIGQDTTGVLWLGSHVGLATWDGQQFKNYFDGQDVDGGIVSIKKDPYDNLWFGGPSGVSFYNYKSELPIPVAREQFNQSVKFIEFIDTSYVVMGGSGKLYFLDLAKFYKGEIDIYEYDQDDGFYAEECLQNASFTDSKDHIWIGTTNAVFELDPEKLKFYREPTLPQFSWVKYRQNEEVIEHRIPHGTTDFTFTATSTNRNYEFLFYTVNHDKPKSIKYRYRLQGYQDNWSLPQKPRFVSFSELPKGNYTFELQACLGNRCSESKFISFRIKAGRWYEFTWVRLSAGGVFVAILLGYLIQWRRQYLAQQRIYEVEKEQLALRHQQMTMRKNLAVHKIGPHFTFNVLNAITDLIIRSENDKALSYISRFANLFRPILAEQGVLFRSIGEEIKLVKDYLKLEKLRFPTKFTADIVVESSVNLEVKIPSMIVHSFVNNAIKHGIEPLGQGGELRLWVDQQEDYLHISITDNGIGRAESQRRTARYASNQGIKMAYDILSYLNNYYPKPGSIEISDLSPDSKSNQGTVVRISLFTGYQED
ncbi:MAG: histidine kinase, partial [Cyanobacteria bacterium J06649_11]